MVQSSENLQLAGAKNSQLVGGLPGPIPTARKHTGNTTLKKSWPVPRPTCMGKSSSCDLQRCDEVFTMEPSQNLRFYEDWYFFCPWKGINGLSV
jgi:hypothetical protein